MKFEEAKPFLKKGMRIKIIDTQGRWEEWEGRECTLSKWWPTGNPLDKTIKGDCCPGPIIYEGYELEILTYEDGITPWEDQKETKFKVGDRVKVLKASISKHLIGKEQTITKIENGRIYTEGGHFGWNNDKNIGEFLELLPSEEPKYHTAVDVAKNLVGYQDWWNIYSNKFYNSFMDYNPPSLINYYQPKSFKRKESKMNSIIQSLQAKLKPTDKTLVKHGYLNSDGTRTSMYEDQLREMAMKKLIDAEDTKEFRAELASELKEDDK